MIKKMTTMILAYLIILGMMVVDVKADSANDFLYFYDDYAEQMTIYGYIGTNPNIVIPEEINGVKVKNISTLYFEKLDVVESITIPGSVEQITVGFTAQPVNNIIVENNDRFIVENGILYSSDFSRMIKCISSITSIEIAENVTSIDFGCFSGTQLTTLTIPDTVSIFNGVGNMNYLKTITVNAPIMYFDYFNCPALEVINLPNTVTDISRYAPSCNSLQAVNIAEGNDFLQSVDGIVYNNNTLYYYPGGKQNIQYVLPDYVDTIGDFEIENRYLKEIILNDKISNISVNFLMGCTSLETISIKSENSPFSLEDGLLYKNKELIYCLSHNQKINIKEDTEIIATNAFAKNEYVEEIVLPDSLNTINYNAFLDCKNLKKINIPENITDLGQSFFDAETGEYIYSGSTVFDGCNSLENIIVAPNNQSFVVEDGALYTADYGLLISYFDRSAESFTVNENTKCINADAFNEISNLKQVDLKNVTKLMYSVFINCSNLESITFDKVNQFELGYTFMDCDSLVNVTLPSEFTGFTSWAPLFVDCDALETINLNNVETFNDRSLVSNCPKVKKLILSKKIKNISFYGYNIYQYYVYQDSYAHQKIEEVNKQIEEGTYSQKMDLIQYHIINEMADTETDIVIDSQLSEVIDENTVLSVDHIEEGNDYNYVASSLENFVMYDITLTKDGQNVELDEGVEVKIPVAQGMNTESCRVYHLSDDNVYTDMNAVYKDGYMVFKTDHFSKYIVTDGEIKTKLGDVNEDGIINFSDAILILQADSQLVELTENQKQAADVNKDKQINFNDAIKILQYDAGIITEF